MTESRGKDTFVSQPRHWIIWLALLVSVFIFYPWTASSSWHSSSDVHALLEFWSASMALTAGLLIMIHFFANGSWLFLIISLGFVLQGGGDAVQAIFSFTRIWGEEQKDIIKFVPCTYMIGRFILVASIYAGWFLRRNYTALARRANLSLLFFGSGFAVSIISTHVLIKLQLPLPDFIRPEHVISRPADFMVALLYIPATALYIKVFNDKQYHTRFVFFIICSLIFGSASQLYMANSQALYDCQFDMAHIMKIISFFLPILGISFGTFQMYTSETEQRTKELRQSNAMLQEEIVIRKEKEGELINYRKRLRSLSSQILQIEDSERRQLAIDLHDHVGQSLMVVKMYLDGLAALSTSEDVRQKRLLLTASIVEQIVQDVRTLTFELSPPVLYELGLQNALEWLAEDFYNKYSLTIKSATDPCPPCATPAFKALIYRIIRELLINVARHAHADTAEVEVRCTAEGVRLTVIDNGCGMKNEDPAHREKTQGGFGLFSVRERIINIGGSMVIGSQQDMGTAITILIPMKEVCAESVSK